MGSTTADRWTWPVGQRVTRTDTSKLGTVTEAGCRVKVKWDDGATSYYNSEQRGNVRLAPME
jgi:hypothetical protein